MFDNQPYGQGGNNVNISTRFNTSVSDTSMLTIGGWNNSLSIRITPSIGVDGNGNRMYDKNRAFQTALTQDNAKALYLLFEKEIKPLMDTNSPSNKLVGVPVGKDTKRTVVNIEMVPVDAGYDMYLTCCTNLDQNNVATEQNIFRHKFKKTRAIKDYQPQTGQGELEEVHADFMNFVDKLQNIGDILPIAHHGSKYADASSAAYRGGNNNQGNSYGNNNYNNGGYSAPSSSANGYNASELPFLS